MEIEELKDIISKGGADSNKIGRDFLMDYDKILSALTLYDKAYRYYDILIQIDKSRTLNILINRLLYEKNINKIAIRKFLFSGGYPVTQTVIDLYGNSSLNQKQAIIKLLLLYKTDSKAKEFLNAVSENEKSKTLKALIIKDSQAKKKERKQSDEDFFTDAMINGTKFSYPEFSKEVLRNKKKCEIAATLFFTLYNIDNSFDIVVVENSCVCDLDNKAVSNLDGKLIGVLHPAEIATRYEYLKRLNITQSLEQLKRKVYYPLESEKLIGATSRYGGTITTVKKLLRNMKNYGFKTLGKDKNGFTNGIYKIMGEYVCAAEFTKTDLSDNAQVLSLGEIRFYRYKDLIKLNGRIYLGNVNTVAIGHLKNREFSEFVYSVYMLFSN